AWGRFRPGISCPLNKWLGPQQSEKSGSDGSNRVFTLKNAKFNPFLKKLPQGICGSFLHSPGKAAHNKAMDKDGLGTKKFPKRCWSIPVQRKPEIFHVGGN
ncbi:MAG: hypothetical protein RR350_08880, partial [Oscillibacter sp.]